MRTKLPGQRDTGKKKCNPLIPITLFVPGNISIYRDNPGTTPGHFGHLLIAPKSPVPFSTVRCDTCLHSWRQRATEVFPARSNRRRHFGVIALGLGNAMFECRRLHPGGLREKLVC